MPSKWNPGDKVCTPGDERGVKGTVDSRDKYGRLLVWWADGSGSYHMDDELVEPWKE